SMRPAARPCQLSPSRSVSRREDCGARGRRGAGPRERGVWQKVQAPALPSFFPCPHPTLPHKGGGLFWLPPPLWGRAFLAPSPLVGEGRGGGSGDGGRSARNKRHTRECASREDHSDAVAPSEDGNEARASSSSSGKA